MFTNIGFSTQQLQNKDVEVKESNASNLVFEYHPQFQKSNFVELENGKYELLKVVNANEQRNESGSPRTIERYISFGLPSYEKPNVTILASDYEDIPNANVLPIPFWEKGEEMPTPVYNPTSEFYSQNKFFPENIFSFEEPKKSGGVSTSTIQIAPFQYNPVTKTLRKYSRVVVKVEFGSAKFIANGKPISENMNDVLINFDVAKHWTMNPQQKSKSTIRFNSVLKDGNWWTIPIQTDGMYKITGATLSANGIPRNKFLTIKIYNNGGSEIPDDPANVSDYGDLMENAIRVVDNNSNGSFEDDDYIVFFGKGLRGWNYNSSSKQFSHFIHHYDEVNNYFLTYGAGTSKQMIPRPVLNDNAIIETFALGKVFREEEKINAQQSGRQWLSELLNTGDHIDINLPLPGVLPQSPLTYKFSLAARSGNDSRFEVFEHNEINTSPIVISNVPRIYDINYAYSIFCNFGAPSSGSTVRNFTDAQSKLRFSYFATGGGTGYIDWIEIFYRRKLQAEGDVFQFHSRDTSAVFEYTIDGFSSDEISCFDITDVANVQLLTPSQRVNNALTFRTVVSSGTPSEFFLSGANGYRTISSMKKIENQNLHGDTAAIEYVIVTHPDFLSQANRLGEYRSMSAKNPLRTRVVTTQQIYNEFSSGVQDVGAMRNYAKYLYETETPGRRIKYFLLFGDGDFDFKRIVGTGPNWVPPWETENSFGTPIESFAGDDFFGSLQTFFRLDIGVGRICTRTEADADNVVNKIIEYETTPIRNGWNNRVMFVADDFKEDGTIHTDQADDLAQHNTPVTIEKVKIYAAEFPTAATSLGRRKPTANEAVIREWNDGALVINYTGHGNPRVWMHEQVFTRETTIPMLRNKGKYPFVVAATCNFAQFDNLGAQSSAEILMNKKESGVIGVFAATRAVYAFSNFLLNKYLYNYLFEDDAFGRILPKRLGDVVPKAKRAVGNLDNGNQYRFFLLGDPALEIAIPRELVVMDTVNGFSVSTSNIALLRSLSKPVIHTRILDAVGNVNTSYSGNGLLSVFDTYQRITIIDDGGSYPYTKRGNSLFRGSVSVQNGKALLRCIIPQDIMYDTSLNGRISLYVWNNETDGAGVTEFVRIGGTDTTAGSDNTGPTIFAYLNTPSFRNGDVVKQNSQLVIELSDSNGINTSGAGVGHRLEAQLDNGATTIDLSPYYRSEVNDFQRGKIQYQLEELTDGEHQLFLRVWDTYNNASESTVRFRVRAEKKLTIENVYNYPNPFSQETYFTFLHNETSPLNVEVKIYTVSGRQIKTIKENNILDPFVKIRWDGRDGDGDEVSNGLYLYKVIARTTDHKFTSEVLGKASLIR